MNQSSLHLKAHRWHKRFGLALAVVTIMWGLSGIAHPIMSRIKPMAQAQQPLLPLDLKQLSAVSRTLAAVPFADDALLLNRHTDTPVVAIKTGDQWQYYDASTGNAIPDFHQSYLASIGATYTGLPQTKVSSISTVFEFNYDYPSVNRYLPAYKIQFDDDINTSVYLDVQSLQLASVSNDYKSFYTKWFSHLHSWDFIPNETVRYGLMLLVTLTLFLSALLGVYITLHRWRRGLLHKGSKSRRAHRYIGLFVCFAALAFSFSGGFHALNKLVGTNGASQNKQLQEASPIKPQDYIQLWQQFIAQTPTTDIQQIQLISVHNQPVLQLHHLTEAAPRHGNHQHGAGKKLIRGNVSYFPHEVAVDGQLASTQALYLQSLLSNVRHKEVIKNVRLQPHFNHEYGFIDKKLPTFRVETETNTYFFDPTAQSLSKTVSNQQLLESMSFSVLHKASFLDGLGRDIRDIVIGLFVLGIIIITLLGVSVNSRPKPPRSKGKS